MFLHLLGIGPLNEPIEIEPLPQETAPPVRMVDFAAVVIVAPGRRFIFHAEFQLDYVSELPVRVARYAVSLAAQYGLPVRSVVLFLRRGGTPSTIPRLAVFEVGDTRTTHPFEPVWVSDLDPEPIFASKDPRLFPWAILMNSSEEQVRRIARAVVEMNDEEMTSRFLTLGSLRYDRSVLEGMLGGPGMGLVEAILEGSSLVQEVKARAEAEASARGFAAGQLAGKAAGAAEGKAEGKAQGKAEGRAEGARRLLRAAMEFKFPEIKNLRAIDAIQDVDVLEALLVQQVLTSSDSAAVEQAILAAASSSNPAAN